MSTKLTWIAFVGLLIVFPIVDSRADGGFIGRSTRVAVTTSRYLTRVDTRLNPQSMTEDIYLALDESPRDFSVRIEARADSGPADSVLQRIVEASSVASPSRPVAMRTRRQ